MKSAAAIVGLLLSVTLAGQAIGAEQGNVYLWVDKDGTPHYQDRPPEGADPETAKALSLRYRMTDAQAMAAAAKDKAALDDVARLREQQQAEDQGAEQSERDQVAKEREQGCEAARAKSQKYETAHRLYRPGPDGKRTYLTDEEIDAARLQARKDVAEWCGE